jgi:hypothetical protein
MDQRYSEPAQDAFLLQRRAWERPQVERLCAGAADSGDGADTDAADLLS